MPSIRVGLVKFFNKILGSTNHSISIDPRGWGDSLNAASPGSPDKKPTPFRIVEKLEQKFISLSPLKFRTEPNQASTFETHLSTRINPTPVAAAEDDTIRKEVTVQNADFTAAKTAAYLECGKPLPLTPRSDSSLSLSLSTTISTETEDRRDDDEKFDSNGNLPRTSDDTSNLV